MSEGGVIEFVTLNEHPEYEILNDFPYTIRRKDNKYVVKESINNCGYVSVCMNGKPNILKHQIIAKQFIDNPNNLPFIDHLNHDRADYHLSNLRWCSAKDNNRNVSTKNGVEYIFIDNIPDESIAITHYDIRNERRFFEEKKYFYYKGETDEDIFYERITDNIYRIMHINLTKGKYKIINTRDINNKLTAITIRIFKYQYGIKNN
ncbi:hypothetical protein M9Y10_024383 [Tritrichomonas musculus]|uniref:HNH nuclease domain-containing protein n=1 Tax=Tritrichomonas musculus TaxID=1915356 RepID=A0ABR2HE50_9EUKA